jgi:alpha-L-rhamnosidase
MKVLILCCVFFTCVLGGQAMTLDNLRCEYRVNPLGIGEREPRLSWVMKDDSGKRGAAQSAYQILVASAPEKLARDEADLWDSGCVRSEKSIQIVYKGRALEARDRCYWKVRVWDQEEKESPWSAPAFWTLGLLHVADWQAEWLRVEEVTPEDAVAKPVPPKLTVISAVYGTHDNQQKVDATEKVRERVTAKGGVLLVQASNESFGDPAVGAGKRLEVVYEVAGKRYTASAPEGAFVTASVSEEASAPRAKRIQTPRCLRRAFQVAAQPVRATLYATALGLYEMRLNGQRVGDALLTPEWTAYDKRVQVQAYDVTPLVRPGANALGALLGNGWYCGRVQCWPPDLCLYGFEPRLKAQLEIEFADGRRQVVATDEAWQGTTDGPLRFSGIYEGETYDARKELSGWDAAGFAPDARWQPALIDRAVRAGALVWQRSEPIRVTQELKPAAVTEPKPGVYVFDFGQNMVGRVRLKVQGTAGDTVELFHNEMLNPDGTVYRDNLHAGILGKEHSQTVRYTLRGGGEETYEPHFTYMGFRYVEVSGLKAKPDASLLTGRVFHTAFAQAGRFACSDPLLTRLAQNIQWSQRGNMMGIPTDCPQRDERAGWTGDAQFFMPTAVYNFDVAAFFSKWLVDLCQDSFVEGKGFADMAPYYGKLGAGNTGWGDAGVVCPYVLYRTYGDTRVIETHYEQMKRHVLTLSASCTNHIRGAGAYGDWLNVGGGAKGEVCGTAYQTYLCDLLSEMATAIGKGDDAARFGAMANDARGAFAKAFFKEDGSLLESSLTGYALAFTMGLVPDALREQAAAKFKGEVERFKDCVATGFIGTPRLLPGLHAAGLDDAAYRMLLRRDYPSWLYPVTLGATTIWERWDGWRPDKGFQDPSMNSFNHYAFGSCGQYLFACVGGIQPLEPGYRQFSVAPVIGEGLMWAKTSYASMYGEIVSEWKKEGGKYQLKVIVPPNTRALIRLPQTSSERAREGGVPLGQAPGLTLRSEGNGDVLVRAVAGMYAFEF